jgi:hypothetical protein
MMYEATPDPTILRQGDILRDIYLPRYAFDAQFLHMLQANGSFAFSNQAVLKAEKRYAIVLSQCCEFNDGKRNSFTLASLITLRKWLHPGRRFWGFNLAELIPLSRSALKRHTIDEMLQANRIDPSAVQNRAVNAYLFEPYGHVLKEHYIADFTQVTSVRMKDKDTALRSKILQLKDEYRREFQRKLGYFYARPAT